MHGNVGGLSGIELLVFIAIYLIILAAVAIAVCLFLRALWRIGDGLYSVSRAIASKQTSSGSD
jgi:hypothetical protein